MTRTALSECIDLGHDVSAKLAGATALLEKSCAYSVGEDGNLQKLWRLLNDADAEVQHLIDRIDEASVALAPQEAA